MSLIALFFLFLGSLFLLLAAIGSAKFPDLFMRMAAVSKAATLGVILSSVGAGFHFQSLEASLKMIMLVGVMFISAPVATHLLGRAAFRNGIPLFHRTRKDDESFRI